MTLRLRRAACTAVLALAGLGLTTLPALAGAAPEPHDGGQTDLGLAAALPALIDPLKRSATRTESTDPNQTKVLVKGRTRKARTVVRIKGWVVRRDKWVVLKKVRSKRHRYATRVALGKVGATKLKAKPRKERAQAIAITDSCGVRPVKADGTLWSCTFSDEFEGNALDRAKWLPQTAGYTTGDATNFACYRDDPANVSVAGGTLRLTLTEGETKPCPGLRDAPTRFSSGSVSTYGRFSQRYGRFEARTRNTDASVSGLHEAFWLWPDDRFVDVTKWPTSGEIDVAETYSRYPNLVVPFLHTKWDALGPLPGVNTAWHCAASRGVYNTYVLEWAPKKIEIFVNGKLCLRNTSGDQAFQEPYIIAFTQGIGGAQNEYSDATPLPATYEVDYIRVWN